MSIEIHPTAMVDGNAQLGEGVKIGPYATIGANVKIGAGTTKAAPGSVVAAGKDGISVACGSGGIVVIKELQVAGKKRMAAADYLLGHPMQVR